MRVYHGTSVTVAQALAAKPSTVSVTIGGGELGRGFYTGGHPSLAAAWARGRFPDPGILEIAIDVAAYVKLAILVLNWAQGVSTFLSVSRLGLDRTLSLPCSPKLLKATRRLRRSRFAMWSGPVGT